jgi:hypothetical protein
VPAADGQRLSYCADCDVIKARAQGRGFSVSQMCDAFERNTVQALFGDNYHFVIGGTRFDPSAAQWAAPDEPPPAPDAAPSLLAAPPPGAAPTLPDLAAAPPGSGDGAGSGAQQKPKKKRKQAEVKGEGLDGGGLGDEDDLGPGVNVRPNLSEEDLATMRKRCALCKCGLVSTGISNLTVPAGICSRSQGCATPQWQCLSERNCVCHATMITAALQTDWFALQGYQDADRVSSRREEAARSRVLLHHVQAPPLPRAVDLARLQHGVAPQRAPGTHHVALRSFSHCDCCR